jgi:hypothetical protein
MSMTNDYLISILHEQRAHDLMAEAADERLARDLRGNGEPWWQKLLRPTRRRPAGHGPTIAVARQRTAH